MERADATVLVTRGLPDEARVSEVAPVAVVAVDVAASALTEAPEEVGGAPLIAIGEDRTLAGFSVSEAQATLRAETLVEGDGLDPTCDHLVIAPIGRMRVSRTLSRFESKAVVGAVRQDGPAPGSAGDGTGLPHTDGAGGVPASTCSTRRLRAACPSCSRARTPKTR